MSCHSAHPRTHEQGLADGCDRCAEHAERPLDGLDTINLEHLIDRVLDGARGRSMNERIAMARITDALARGQKLARVPRAVAYMMQREEAGGS